MAMVGIGGDIEQGISSGLGRFEEWKYHTCHEIAFQYQGRKRAHTKPTLKLMDHPAAILQGMNSRFGNREREKLW